MIKKMKANTGSKMNTEKVNKSYIFVFEKQFPNQNVTSIHTVFELNISFIKILCKYRWSILLISKS